MMATWLRKMRGVVGTGLIWGLPGAVVGAIGGVVASVFGGAPLLGTIAYGGFVLGGTFFLLGTSFAALLALGEGRRTLDELTPWRAAAWGAVAGGVAPFLALLILEPGTAVLLSDPRLLTAFLAASGSYGALTAAMAAGTIAVARRAPGQLPSGGSTVRARLVEATGDE
jgi:hypothetical protein